MCAVNVYFQYDKSFNNAQTIKTDLLNKFKSLILTKALLEPSVVNNPSNHSMHILKKKKKKAAVGVTDILIFFL